MSTFTIRNKVTIFFFSTMCALILTQMEWTFMWRMRRISIYQRFRKVFLVLFCYVVFPSGWNFKLRTKEFPNHPTTVASPNSYMLIPHSARNIAHYMEVYNIIYHILHQPHRYPKVSLCLTRWLIDWCDILSHNGEQTDLSLDQRIQGNWFICLSFSTSVWQYIPWSHDLNVNR